MHEFQPTKLSEALKTLPEIAFGYLFASAQKGTIMEGSDPDVAVYMVHRYESIDTEIVFAIIKNKLNLIEKFVEEIRSYNSL